MAKVCVPRRGLKAQSGLTLIEMLVAMVILGFVMALVSEVVYQVSQVARAADAVSRVAAARWGTGWSASSLFANLLAPEEAGDNAVLSGSTREISGYTSQPLDGSDRGIQAFVIELRPGPDGADNVTELVWSPSDIRTRTNSQPAVIAQFQGRAEFAFLDRSGQIQLAWPVLTRSEDDAVESLPQAVMVRNPSNGSLLMWYGFEGETIKPKPTVGFIQ